MTRKQTQSRLAPILKRQYWHAADAALVVSAWQESGSSMSAFARRQGLDPRRLMRWRRRLATQSVVRFHPVQVVSASSGAPAPDSGGVEIVLHGGRRVAVRRGFDALLLEQVVRAAETWSC
jgi:hypothetical protein